MDSRLDGGRHLRRLHFGLGRYNLGHRGQIVCRGANTTGGEIQNLIVAYLNTLPDKGEQAAVGLIGSALGEAFPCHL